MMRVPDKLAGLSIPEYHRQMGYTAGAGLSARPADSCARIGAASDDEQWRG